jgi:hypothetical protein
MCFVLEDAEDTEGDAEDDTEEDGVLEVGEDEDSIATCNPFDRENMEGFESFALVVDG